MKHVEDIKDYATMVFESEQFHALIVQSPPGWAKSTTITEALNKLGKPWVSIGAYSTPLFFYNALCQHKDKIIVLDDCAGLFDNMNAMSILKAATWPSSGKGDRIVAWGSTSEKVVSEFVNFKGKLILLTNVLPKGRDTEAFLSRSVFYSIRFTKGNIEKMLKEASGQKKYYPNTRRAKDVAKFLIENMAKRDYTKVNLRTLQQGYDLAGVVPKKKWGNLFEQLLPQVEPKELVSDLARTDEFIEDQCRHFINVTGMSRRVFFKYRAELGLAGSPETKAKSKMKERVAARMDKRLALR